MGHLENILHIQARFEYSFLMFIGAETSIGTSRLEPKGIFTSMAALVGCEYSLSILNKILSTADGCFFFTSFLNTPLLCLWRALPNIFKTSLWRNSFISKYNTINIIHLTRSTYVRCKLTLKLALLNHLRDHGNKDKNQSRWHII